MKITITIDGVKRMERNFENSKEAHNEIKRKYFQRILENNEQITIDIE